jgi:hypothetical protein
LRKVVEDRKYSDKAKSYVTELEAELKSERLKDFDISKPILKKEIEKEIMRKYNKPEKDIVETGLKEDIQLQTAISILRDRAMYNSLLNIRQ